MVLCYGASKSISREWSDDRIRPPFRGRTVEGNALRFAPSASHISRTSELEHRTNLWAQGNFEEYFGLFLLIPEQIRKERFLFLVEGQFEQIGQF